MRRPTICMRQNKGADQLRSNCEADQRLCFHYTDSTILLLSKYKISSLWPFSVLVQLGWCRNWSETQIVGFLMQRLKLKFKIPTQLAGGWGRKDKTKCILRHV